MFKKSLSVLLAVLMVVSVLAVGIVNAGAESYDDFVGDPTKLYFDAKSTGWDLAARDAIAFYAYPLSADVPSNYKSWGGKRLLGTDKDGDGIWEYDATPFLLEDGVQYRINFYHAVNAAAVAQTYDLFFDTTCLGHVAYCNGTMYENPVDSSKKTLAAFWAGKDDSEYGPVLQLSSIGNVLGTCPEQGRTPYDIFVDYISVVSSDSGKTGLDNSRVYVVDLGTKTEQKLIDDIGEGLGLTKEDVEKAFTDNAVETVWTAADSTLPGGSVHEHTPAEPVVENEVAATCTAEGSYDEVVYCTECGEEISRETKTIDKIAHTPGEKVYENENVTHDDTTYEEVVYCTVCGEEISRVPVEYPILTHTPGEAKVENEVPATCSEEGSYDLVVRCTECGEEISRETKTTEKIAHTLETTYDIIEPATCTKGCIYDEIVYCSVCGEEISRTRKTSEEKMAHTPGETVIENVVEADCEHGGSYDEVVYCAVCGVELEAYRETVTTDPLGHDIVFVDEVPATASTDGVKAHYECTQCGKCFADATGTVEVDPADLVIKAEHMRGDADGDGELTSLDVTVIQRVLAEYEESSYDEIAADADLDGIVDMVDVALLQRVLADIITFDKWDALHA